MYVFTCSQPNRTKLQSYCHAVYVVRVYVPVRVSLFFYESKIHYRMCWYWDKEGWQMRSLATLSISHYQANADVVREGPVW